MLNAAKIWLIVGAGLVLLGLIIFAIVMSVHQWDFSLLSTVKYVTNTYSFSESITDIAIETTTADILFATSGDNSCKVVCHEQEKRLHTVTLQDGILRISEADERKWYDHVSISFDSPKLTVYLPQSIFGMLTLRAGTGDVTLPAELNFESMDICITTGDVDSSASVSGIAAIKTTTGDIRVENCNASALELSVSTGQVTVSKVSCHRDMSIGVTTGDTSVTDVTCLNLSSHGSTGDLNLSNVVASESFNLKRSTGDICFDRCDAGRITVKTSTGSVTGSLLSDKVFTANTDTGHVNVPPSTNGGQCELTTDTGHITITIDNSAQR